MDTWMDPVSDVEALTAGCPFCGAGEGAMCVYTTEPNTGPRGRTGTPCRVHIPRRDVIRDRRIWAWRRAREEGAATRATAVAAARRRAIADAERMFDLREYERLRAWLREHGPILWQASCPR